MSTTPRKTVPVLTEVLQVLGASEDAALTPIPAEPLPTLNDLHAVQSSAALATAPATATAVPASPVTEDAALEQVALRVLELLQRDVDHPAVKALRQSIDGWVRTAVDHALAQRLPEAATTGRTESAPNASDGVSDEANPSDHRQTPYKARGKR
jgi:hypothetical protein